MAVIVIGGQARKVGKTSVICALLAAMPDKRWTAIKISPHRHTLARAGEAAPISAGAPEAIAVHEETDRTAGTDSSRYLAAGATRSLLISSGEGHFDLMMPRILEEIALAEAGGGHVILESNRVVEFLEPEVYAVVLDPQIGDCKRSVRRHFHRADALLVVPEAVGEAVEPGSPTDAFGGLFPDIRVFRIGPPAWFSPGFAELIADKLHKSGK